MISAIVSSIYFFALTISGMATGPALHQALPIANTIATIIASIPGSADALMAAANAINSPVLDAIFQFVFC